MNRLRTGYVFLALSGLVAVACSSSTDNASKSSPTTNQNNVDPGASSSGNVELDGSSNVIDPPDSSTGGPVGTGTVTDPPPDEKCGAGEPKLCGLKAKCAADADCESGLCGKVGASTGMCISAPSCTGGAGADFTCGPAGNEDCCHTIPVPGGKFTNYNWDSSKPEGSQFRPSDAEVSAFALDEFEVTVGRLRAFFSAKQGNLRDGHPKAGDGAHPLIAGTGWRDSWNVRLPSSFQEINDRMIQACSEGGDNANWGATTWTADPGANESKPANCIDWYTLYAFCAWDGGRMPTDLEWSYVALGGDQELTYPYGNDKPTFESHKDILVTSFVANQDASYGVYTEGPTYRGQADGPLHISVVGKKLERSKWGHADLGGNVIEFVMEVPKDVPTTCHDCAINLSYPDPPQNEPGPPPTWKTKNPDGTELPGDDFAEAKAVKDGKRLARGGSWMGEYEGHWLETNKARHWYPVWRTYSALGVRCARDIKKP
ncbi:MAG: SUMF1/EgtB/PvdO family nonheme iron enzyme [Labilithrix sp.]